MNVQYVHVVVDRLIIHIVHTYKFIYILLYILYTYVYILYIIIYIYNNIYDAMSNKNNH